MDVKKLNKLANLFFFVLAQTHSIRKVSYNEKEFRWALNEDEMATDKLADGIRKFAVDAVKLESMIRKKLGIPEQHDDVENGAVWALH